MFFQLLSTITVKIVDKMMQSGYLCVILYVKQKKKIISWGFNLIFNTWLACEQAFGRAICYFFPPNREPVHRLILGKI